MTVRILIGDVRERLKELPAESVHCIVTSPPYWGLRDYGVAGQIGLEEDFRDYVATMVSVFRDARRVLRSDGTLWLNMGDCYNSGTQFNQARSSGLQGGTGYSEATDASWGGHRPLAAGLKSKDLMGMPWRVAFALQEDGWWLRRDVIWAKPNPMPESVDDRPTTAHEYLFLLSKSARYFFDAAAVREPGSENSHGGAPIEGGPKQAAIGQQRGGKLGIPARRRGLPPRHAQYQSSDRSSLDDVQRDAGRNIRSVWTIATEPFKEAHFATFPPALIEPCIKAGAPEGGAVLDPFGGAGTTGLVADRLKRNAILIELNPAYAEMARRRLEADGGMFSAVEIDPPRAA